MPIQFPKNIDLSDLTGQNGFTMNAIDNGVWAIKSVSFAGDINNDGIVDLILGAPHASPNGPQSGQAYLIFGSKSIGNTGIINLANLNGNNGFKINGIVTADGTGTSVSSAGDINTDGIDDLIVAAPRASFNGTRSGQSYIIFGSIDVGKSGTIQSSDLNGKNGFIINGGGYSVSQAGDINNDGVDDLVIGNPGADSNGIDSGTSYVIFGKESVGNSGTFELSNLNGSNGFTLNGIAASDNSGYSVSQAGDINNDGIGDLIIGAWGADPNGELSGQSYVVFGGESVGSTGSMELSHLNGINGFMINGIAAGDWSGFSVSQAGDINNDGIGDLIIGAPDADPNGFYSGQSYVIFGNTEIGSSGSIQLSSLTGKNGFIINGITLGDHCGINVASAGDVNTDGIADVIIGGYGTVQPDGSYSGQSYVIFGDESIGSSGIIELSDLNGQNGFAVTNQITSSSFSGTSVASVGDINDDGAMDIGMVFYSVSAVTPFYNCQSYVVFGDFPVSLASNKLSINQGEVVVINQNDLSATAVHYKDNVIQFIVTGIQNGHFELISDLNVPITNFFQQDIINGQIQFVQDWSIHSPSYNISAFTGRWTSTIPEAALINFGPIVLVNNTITINQGDKKLLNSENLGAIDNYVPDNKIVFIINKLQYGQFEKVTLLGNSLYQFTQQQINAGKIQFVQDGTANVPSYSVIVNAGGYTLPPSASNVIFYYAPTLDVNMLTIEQGKTVILSAENLKATDKYVVAPELVFSISELKYGKFSFVTDIRQSITEFSQEQLKMLNIQFTQDGSSNAPSYKVSVIADKIASEPQAATVNWISNIPSSGSTSAKIIRGVLAGVFGVTGIIGSLFFCYATLNYVKNRRLDNLAKYHKTGNVLYYQETVLPIAKAVFRQVKVTGFMNYISTDQMEAYVAEIATIVNEINRLGINIEIQHMSPEQSTELLTQIVKQIKQHLNIKTGKCNRAWFTSFFKPQVTPEMINENAQVIAESVHDALLVKNEAGIIALPANVDLLNVVGQAPSEDGFTTGYVQMP